jgi:hypothetical protein
MGNTLASGRSVLQIAIPHYYVRTLSWTLSLITVFGTSVTVHLTKQSNLDISVANLVHNRSVNVIITLK